MGLDAEVGVHGVAFPASQDLGDLGVDVATEECGGAARAKGAGADAFGGMPDCWKASRATWRRAEVISVVVTGMKRE